MKTGQIQRAVTKHIM